MTNDPKARHLLQAHLRQASSKRTRVVGGEEYSLTRKRAGVRRPTDPSWARFQLVEVDGVLDWEDATHAAPVFGAKKRGTGGVSTGGSILSLEFDKLPPSKVTEFLNERDKALTPQNGLRRLKKSFSSQAVSATQSFLEQSPAPQKGRMLLLIHGTFSNGDHFVNSLMATPHGKAFLTDAAAKYGGNVFTFDHPTLAVGPLFNAVDLARTLTDSTAKIDIVSHSRGGLVTRWWCEAFDPQGQRCEKAVVVGSPLAGTGLAAPPNLRNAIRLLTNVGNALGKVAGMASAAVPVLAVVEVMLQVLTTVTSWTAKTPVIDAVVAMVPGLFAQSRVGNNPELIRLLDSSPVGANRYFGVASNFEPTDSAWAFWRLFRKERLADFGADLVFDGKNDLVVDTESMTQLSRTVSIKPNQLFDFGNSATIHHLNYFSDDATIKFLRQVLQVN